MTIGSSLGLEFSWLNKDVISHVNSTIDHAVQWAEKFTCLSEEGKDQCRSYTKTVGVALSLEGVANDVSDFVSQLGVFSRDAFWGLSDSFRRAAGNTLRLLDDLNVGRWIQLNKYQERVEVGAGFFDVWDGIVDCQEYVDPLCDAFNKEIDIDCGALAAKVSSAVLGILLGGLTVSGFVYGAPLVSGTYMLSLSTAALVCRVTNTVCEQSVAKKGL